MNALLRKQSTARIPGERRKKGAPDGAPFFHAIPIPDSAQLTQLLVQPFQRCDVVAIFP